MLLDRTLTVVAAVIASAALCDGFRAEAAQRAFQEALLTSDAQVTLLRAALKSRPGIGCPVTRIPGSKREMQARAGG